MATLGKTSVGGTTSTLNPANVFAAGPYTASENGTIDSVSIYTGNARPITVGVYGDSAGAPGALVGDSAGTTSTAGGWTTVAVAGSLVSGQPYWIAWAHGTDTLDTQWDAGSKTIQIRAVAYSAGNLPDPFGSPTPVTSRDYSAYITYTPTSSPLTAGTLSVTDATHQSVSLSTTAATGGSGGYTYKLQRAPDSGGSAGAYADVGSYQAGTTWNDTGLTAGTTYWYRVVAKDSADDTDNTNELSQATDAAPVNAVVLLGDSLTRGTGGTTGAGTVTGTVYPAKVMDALGPSWYGTNAGVGSDTLTQMEARLSTDVYPHLDGTSENVVIVLGGINDIAGGANAATTYARLVSLCEQIRTDEPDALIVVGTILPTGTSGYNTVSATVNASIRANWRTYADALADFAFDDRLSDAGDTTYFDADAVHLNDAGQLVMAWYGAAGVASALSPGGSSGGGGVGYSRARIVNAGG